MQLENLNQRAENKSKNQGPSAKCEHCKTSFYGHNRSISLKTHACPKRDQAKDGAYHWCTYYNNNLQTLYFGHGQTILESLRFLSLPGHYAVGTSKINNEPSLSSAYRVQYTKTVDDAFANEDGFIYLVLMELDQDHQNLPINGISKHAESICLSYMNGLVKSDSKRKYYLNSLNTSGIIDNLRNKFNYHHYIKRSIEEIQNQNSTKVIKFNKKQFLQLIDLFHQNCTFISLLNKSDNYLISKEQKCQETVNKNIDKFSAILTRNYHINNPTYFFNNIVDLFKKLNGNFPL